MERKVGDGVATVPRIRFDSRSSQISRWIVSLFVVLPVVAAVGLAIFAAWAANRIDVITSDREKALLEQAMKDRLSDFSKEQFTVSTWDDTVAKAKSGDQAWLTENAAEWLYQFYGHDEVIIVDPNDKPILGMLRGKSISPGKLRRQVEELKQFLTGLRFELSKTDDLNTPMVSGWISHRGRPAMIGIRPVLPSRVDGFISPADLYFHIDIEYFDGTILSSIGERHQLRNVRFAPLNMGRPSGSYIVLSAIGNGPIGYIVWDSDQPGFDLLKQTAPALCAVVALLALLIWLLLSRLRKAAQEIARRQSEAVHLAFHDPLTGLANRAMMNERLDREVRAARNGGLVTALHYLDLDRFKHVNDTLGHPAGDNLIKQVAERLRAVAGPNDLVARLGGDEFALIQAGLIDRREAEVLAERILSLLRLPFDLDGNQAFIDGSVGIALTLEDDSRADIVRRADIALYQVKENGKGHHCFFERQHDEELLHRQVIETDLRLALDLRTGLSLMFQPLFAADGKTIRSAEALLRWSHRSLGEIEPAVFIPIAEERGVMPRLGLWVIEEALRIAVRANLPSVAVNLSAAQFRDEHLADRILDLIREFEFSPERLRLEITEGLLLDSGDVVGRALTKLRFAGVQISLDDFGTGYSSLNYLRRYKVDGIKIDRSFVHKLGAPDNTDAIVRAVLDLARALKLEVTAEGVETEYQWKWLVAAGCTEFQGFLFARPLSADDLGALCGGAGEGFETGKQPQSRAW